MNVRDNKLCQIANKVGPFRNIMYSAEVQVYIHVLNMQLREFMGSFREECACPEDLRSVTCEVERIHQLN
jgi:hypothetical protein